MMLLIQRAKSKFSEYQVRAVSPNLMLTKVSYHIVFVDIFPYNDIYLQQFSGWLSIDDRHRIAHATYTRDPHPNYACFGNLSLNIIAVSGQIMVSRSILNAFLSSSAFKMIAAF